MSNVVKGIVAPLALAQEMLQEKQRPTEHGQKGGGAAMYLSYIFHIIMFVAAIYLSWKCNFNSGTVARVLWAVLAGIFNVFYLIYYIIYRVLMGAPCG